MADVDAPDCEISAGLDPDQVISQLPEEVWLEVLSYFTSRELCSLGLVCKSLLRLTRDPGLWSEVTLLGDAIASTETVQTLFRRCSQLTRLSIRTRDDVPQLLPVLSASCPLLSHLQIKFCQPLTFTDLSHLATGCRRIKVLNLESTGCLNCDGDAHEMEGSNTCNCGPDLSFAKLLANFPQLTDLNLFHCRNLHSKGLMTLAESCQNLQVLNIDEVTYLSDESVNLFLDLRGPHLKQLSIDGESLSDESFKNFLKMINLEFLSISFADSLGSAGLSSISRLSKLEWLKIRRGAELEPEAFVSAFNEGHLANLLHLNLSECSKLDDAGVISIAKNCPNLGTLQLDWCWEVTDVGVMAVVSSCKYLINLQLLGVVRLEGKFLQSISQCLMGLKLLDLEQCPDIQLEDLQQLLSIKQRLHIKDYYGERVRRGQWFDDFDLFNDNQILFCSSEEEEQDLL